MPARKPVQPPVAKKIPKVDVLHGDRRVDDYFWLREKTNPAVMKYLRAENAYTDAVMKPTEKFQGALYKEMLAHIKETDFSVPVRYRGWWYYSRTEKGKQYPIHCRKRGSLDAPEEVILDLNQLARGKKFLAVAAFEVSDDGNLLAYSLDFTGFRDYTLFTKDLRTGKVGVEKIPKTGTVAWAADNRTLFYTVEDEAKRQYRLYRHRLGQVNDELIFEEKDELYDIAVARSRSKEFLFLDSTSKTTTEVRYLGASQPEAAWKIIAPRQHEHEYDVDHHGDTFYIRSNKGGRNFGLYTAPVAKPGSDKWTVLIPHRTNVMIEGVELFASHYVVLERENALPRVTITDLNSGKSQRIQFDEPAYEVEPENNPEWETGTFRYAYQSFVTPKSVFDFDLKTRQSKLLKRIEVPGYDAAQYQSERIFATAKDGTRVPISLVYRKGFKRDGAAPLLLDGYGSYGIVNDVRFSSSRLALLDRGVVFAQAHIRGGGELGKVWHDQGRMMNKKNTFADFIAAADFLVRQKYCARERLVITGGSAGGLLMGAVLNLRPDLCKAVMTRVPFVDVINTMLDETLPLTVSEFEEWGNPKKKSEYDYMRSYSPYDNVRAAAYPSMLVKTSINDSQVMYWEPTKYVAKLRALKSDTNPLLYHINLSAGHGGSSGRYDYLKETAFDYAFILGQVGITE
ncbi:MAG TPA: S9 family peptidase [Verrucomicrobiae bacterium]